MKNEDFKFDRDRIDDEMNEMFTFDPECGEKAVHDAIKEKMRAEAVRKKQKHEKQTYSIHCGVFGYCRNGGNAVACTVFK